MYIDHNAPSKKITKPISTQTSYDNFYEVLDSMKAEFIVLKSFVINELYAINLNIDRVRTEQCDQTEQLGVNSKNMWKAIATKNTFIKLLSENHNLIKNSFYETNLVCLIEL